MTKKPDKALYLKVGHNDEEVIKKMKEKTDEEKRQISLDETKRVNQVFNFSKGT